MDDRLTRLGHATGVLGIGGAVLLAILLAAPTAFGAQASYIVLSDSMAPSMQTGDVVVVRSADAHALAVGDVVTYRTEEGDGTERITHRVVDVVQTDDGVRYETRGDANESPDAGLLEPRQVVGTVWFHVPLVGRLALFARTGLGVVSLVIVPAVLLVCNELYSLYREATRGGGGVS